MVTDHEPVSIPPGVELLGVGRPLDQCGFAGMRVEGDTGRETWTATIRNYGDRPAERAWGLVVDGQAATQGTVRLQPDQTRAISGDFPPDRDRFELVMATDALAVDDRLPVVRPRPKRLAVAARVEAAIEPLVEKLFRSLPALDRVRPSEDADLEIYSYEPGILPDLGMHRICVPRVGAPAAEPEGLVVAETHPLTEGLSWGGLLCGAVDPGPLTDADEVLVWQGARPLVILRRGSEHEHLVLAFDLPSSNAERIPGFVILLHRFVERIRAAKPALTVDNVEVSQRLPIPADPDGGPLVIASDGGEAEIAARTLPVRQRDLLRAPDQPGFFTVSQDGRILFEGAARFADVREADLRGASSFGSLGSRVNEVKVRNSRPDPAAPIWGALLIAAVLGSWAARGGTS